MSGLLCLSNVGNSLVIAHTPIQLCLWQHIESHQMIGVSHRHFKLAQEIKRPKYIVTGSVPIKYLLFTVVVTVEKMIKGYTSLNIKQKGCGSAQYTADQFRTYRQWRSCVRAGSARHITH
jgi:hypothetical protein